jgi:hypothetical protein
MGLLGKLFGGRQRAVTSQLPQVQDATKARTFKPGSIDFAS